MPKFRQEAIDALAVSVVTADEIRTYGYRTLGDVIGSMRGVYTVRSLRHLWVGARFRPRRRPSNRILLLIDGIRRNDAVFNQAMVGTESPLDIDLIDRRVRSPARVLPSWPRTRSLGVINVITKNGSALSRRRGPPVPSERLPTAKGRLTYGVSAKAAWTG